MGPKTKLIIPNVRIPNLRKSIITNVKLIKDGVITHANGHTRAIVISQELVIFRTIRRQIERIHCNEALIILYGSCLSISKLSFQSASMDAHGGCE